MANYHPILGAKGIPTVPSFLGVITWRTIPFSKWLVTPIEKPFRPFGRGTIPLRGLINY